MSETNANINHNNADGINNRIEGGDTGQSINSAGEVAVSYKAPSEAMKLLRLGILFVVVAVIMAIVTKETFPLFLAIGGSLLWVPIVVWAIRSEITKVEILNSGTIVFGKAMDRDSFPVRSLKRITGSTGTRGSYMFGRPESECIEFHFETETRTLRLKRRDDLNADKLFRYLESTFPEVDTTQLRS